METEYHTLRVMSVEMCRRLYSPVFSLFLWYPWLTNNKKEVVIMLGTRIAALRREAGLSQAELAQRLQVSPSALGMYEQERREPSMQTLVKLSRELGVTTDYLLTGTPAEKEREELEEMLLGRIRAADQRLEQRRERPFSREELAVLFAAMLMDA